MTFETDKKLPSFEIWSADIVKIVRSLDPNKAHELNEISIHMRKICTSLILKPLVIVFRSCFKNKCFPKEWKKANTVPVDKKMINN